MLGVVAAPQRRDGGVEPGGVELVLGGRERRRARQARQDPAARLLDLGALVAPRLRHADAGPATRPACPWRGSGGQ